MRRVSKGGDRHGQRGSVLIVALITLSALLMFATITVIRVERGVATASEARFRSVALFAAESGVSAGMDFLRNNVVPVTFFTAFISPDNTVVQTPLGIPGNTLVTSDPNSLFSGNTDMLYEVSLLNNVEDPGLGAGSDSDGVIILRSKGYGPGTAMVIIEVEIDGSALATLDVLSWRVIQ